MLTIKITPNETGNPPGKLADAEIHFGPEAGILAGLKLIGFSVWETRTNARRNVTFPARQYAVNGERRSFALLRPIMDATSQEAVRAAILEAFDRFERDAHPIEAAIKAQRSPGYTSPVPVAREAANLETRARGLAEAIAKHADDTPLDSRITSEAPPARKEATPPQDLF